MLPPRLQRRARALAAIAHSRRTYVSTNTSATSGSTSGAAKVGSSEAAASSTGGKGAEAEEDTIEAAFLDAAAASLVAASPPPVAPPPAQPGEACIPGCGASSQQCEELHSSGEVSLSLQQSLSISGGCFYTPRQVGAALAQQRTMRTRGGSEHNEMVVEAASVVDALPSSIQAVYFSASAGTEEIAYAKAVHAALLQAYAMDADAAGSPPLLLLDLMGGGEAPFSLPGKAWLD